jgi:hypothetical protein
MYLAIKLRFARWRQINIHRWDGFQTAAKRNHG